MSIIEEPEGIKDIFNKRGLRCTPQRLAVLKVLHDTQVYLSISAIHSKVKEILPYTGLATVYRSLETLVSLRLAVKVHLDDGCHSYAIAPQGHCHPILCTECNRVVEFAECPLEDLSNRISEKTGVQIDTHFLQLFGKCEECRI